MEQAINLAVQVISDPRVQLGAAFLFVYLLPNGTLKRIPVLGSVAEAVMDSWSRQKLQDAMRKEGFLEQQATRTVQALEQEIKRGTLDQVSARAEGVSSLIERFGVPQKKAAELIEAAVFRINQGKLPVLGEYVPGDVA